jgi:hypothetical protein
MNELDRALAEARKGAIELRQQADVTRFWAPRASTLVRRGQNAAKADDLSRMANGICALIRLIEGRRP